ncbi:stage II sporulation protein R [Paenibacillus phyllosphaerae]|uniref:Stage II sporulation protein R n=1 Tax=Paenibacillus phyllosphaerae TaxID=274593 RepID=A0A7W5FN20_9BACL|nr:stage II sporulation protein R [Paenibacillus phyllosphaerae]MBB3110594.1 stage II sporulation protein R [Paenibacillus phyllosphaerae]
MIRTYSRFPYKKSYGYLFVILAILFMSWESQRADAAIAGGDIPTESIRLRILANSDSAVDQAVKRHVRDAVVAEMDRWIEGQSSIEQARLTIHAHMHDIERVVAGELAKRGFNYGFKAELGVVPFPTKMYGNKVYPAGEYEALRITLGSGEGQNWWCVLFPPLCFVDAVSGEASAAAVTTTASVEVTKDAAVKDAGAANTASNADAAVSTGEQQAPEVKFFLWEMIESIISWIGGLFS